MSEFRIDQIKSQDATRGPDVAGITTFTGTSGIVMPSGDTAYRGGRSRAVRAGGIITSPATARVDNMDYFTIATLGNAVDFGDLTGAKNDHDAVSSSTRGFVVAGNDPSSTKLNVIEFVTIATTGNAADFGDLTQARSQPSSCSDVHGGLG